MEEVKMKFGVISRFFNNGSVTSERIDKKGLQNSVYEFKAYNEYLDVFDSPIEADTFHEQNKLV